MLTTYEKRSSSNVPGSYTPYRISERSNFSSSQCYNQCGFLHPFNKSKRNECREQCEKDAQVSQQQQQTMQDIVSGDSGISTGAILGIVAGIVGLTIGGVLLLRKKKGGPAGAGAPPK